MPRPITDQERLARYVDQTGDCWLWTGALNKGYGVFTSGYRIRSAHRWSYELHVGPIPDGLTLDHTCRVRRCVRPDHLEPVTQGENVRRGLIVALREKPTVCGNGHDLTQPGAIAVRHERGRTRERCRECERARGRRRNVPVGDGSVSP